jgi:predicted small lipoprotein YifL
MQWFPAMRTMMVAVLVMGALAGCGTAGSNEWVYAKPGASEAQRQRDEQACRMSAVGTADTKPMPTWGQTMNRDAFNECMRARGYDVRLGQLRP